ncbi:hypothetical protein BY996DRAFT_8457966 [Phakopsora pachyrhizi]|uniref:SET domain-containing protein n=1 Tax=Phakopsora pachyrhizi TaxID=170000 RepID=A0AAV0BCS8_PHAPC|nr:hypothetical protein BY996DRAFT_4601145 [Phakopsora pachyrhizi]KAI8446257.1 hypothetical protein BY996DRAFT_8457966 [Phakopsora pachyrhizi]CAH7672815.1 hypothetical protein PPACK8108_LOCUS7653 [Phakopsora pachyrhizi]CAH7684562.1 hypothetical protein PPACK8108_LOCUS18803 [Phakopsora pachyrhizi]
MAVKRKSNPSPSPPKPNRPLYPSKPSSDSNLWYIAFTLATIAILFSQEISDYIYANNESRILKHRSAQRNPDITAWAVVPMKSRGGGYGVIAERDILPGELIMKESPLIKVRLDHSSIQEAEKKIEDTVKSISGEDRIRLLSLSNAWENQTYNGAKLGRYSGLLQTNGMNSGRGFFSIFPSISRLNHACMGAVNAVYNWRENEKVQVVHVTKPIKAGEEIFISYFDSKLPRSDRRSYLRSNYGFECSCKICSKDSESSKESDLRITNINSLKASLSAWQSGAMGGAEAVDLIETALDLMRQEGMTYEFGQLYADACHIATAHSDFQNARKYATLALKHFEVELGNDSVEYNYALKMIKNPTHSSVWRSRPIESVRSN